MYTRSENFQSSIWKFTSSETSLSCRLKMEAVNSSETSINIYQSIWCGIPEDLHLQNIYYFPLLNSNNQYTAIDRNIIKSAFQETCSIKPKKKIFGIPFPLCMYTVTISIYTKQTQQCLNAPFYYYFTCFGRVRWPSSGRSIAKSWRNIDVSSGVNS